MTVFLMHSCMTKILHLSPVRPINKRLFLFGFFSIFLFFPFRISSLFFFFRRRDKKWWVISADQLNIYMNYQGWNWFTMSTARTIRCHTKIIHRTFIFSFIWYWIHLFIQYLISNIYMYILPYISARSAVFRLLDLDKQMILPRLFCYLLIHLFIHYSFIHLFIQSFRWETS